MASHSSLRQQDAQSNHKTYKIDLETSLFNEDQLNTSINSRQDPLHAQYLREKPLLDEIRLLRQGKDEAERRLRLVEGENRALLRRVKELEQQRSSR